MKTQQKRREKTRASILKTARTLFIKDGFENVSLDNILAAAGISKGGFYHHFDGKKQLFACIYEEMSLELVDTAKSPNFNSYADSVVSGLLSWVKAVRQPGIAEIILVQGPRVLGWEQARAIEQLHGLKVIKSVLTSAQENKELAPCQIDLISHALIAVVSEIVMFELANHSSVENSEIERILQNMIPLSKK